ncbi:MAG: DNA gyrase inhibitor YacG [Oceanicoccus sp.]|uniref:DNA gyrase inhibitor YacG n=1 Tax=Oceanicoccus sp. TaxID=2691044 RepID=UPI002602D691|nr:DNA gyrase inhibitor YacG [Oceanicoccus sp.]MCP3907784.1 DNA gyrase inhibitor YacG [Oceanicoccus sp.]MCP4929024.1 DNA gyrase inhibitor YacG [Gammaproteobacteria bacterium]MDG1772894.1 DNA gyrase inhibitor YacG [Oceanicoccus sp.]
MTSKTLKSIPCPHCKTPVVWNSNNENRPFCSESCRNKDFIGWANEEKVMKGNSLYDDVLSNELLKD